MPTKANQDNIRGKGNTTLPNGPQSQPPGPTSPGLEDFNSAGLAPSGDLSPAKVLALQRISGNRAVQRLLSRTESTPTLQASPDGERPNQTGLPDGLKSGVESLSSLSLADVRVHFNSSLPQSYAAHAFTAGSDIHVSPGQERALPHEAWHVVQQKQGRVQANIEVNRSPVNADADLEREADQMGQRAAALDAPSPMRISLKAARSAPLQRYPVVLQMNWWEKVGEEIKERTDTKPGGYRMVKGLKAPDGKSPVFETDSQRRANLVVAPTRDEIIEALPKVGEFNIDPTLVMYSQDSINRLFTNGSKVEDTVESLKKGHAKSSSFPAIRIFKSAGGRLVTLDNRRLYCCKSAGVLVKCTWASAAEIENEDFKFTSGKGFEGKATIIVR